MQDAKEQVSTPMMKQFLRIKKQHPDDVIFFRLGDFYEMFFEDARLASSVLDIALTSRDGGNDVEVPMAGVPVHAADGYLQKLVEKGHRVAICEQVEDAAEATGLVDRDVVRVVTPGTRLDAGVVGSSRDNLAAAVICLRGSWGMAVADISTGYFSCVQVEGDDADRKILGEMARHSPAECCHQPDGLSEEFTQQLDNLGHIHLRPMDEWAFAEDECRRLLKDHFEVADLGGFGCDGRPLAVRAAGALLRYLRDTQKDGLRQLTRLQTYHVEDFLVIDPVARRTLELTSSLSHERSGGTLLQTLDSTETPMGGRLLRRYIERPLRNPAQINRRLDAVQLLVDSPSLRDELRKALDNIADLERLAGRITYGSANARDLAALGNSLSKIPQVQDALQTLAYSGAELWSELAGEIDVLEDVCEEIEAALVDEPPVTLREGGLIRRGYDEEIDELRQAAEEGKDWMDNLQQQERDRTGIPSLKVGQNKVFGYYIEVTNAHKDRVPDNYERKQTLVNSERYITPELKEKEAAILGAEERLAELEYEAFAALREWVGRQVDRIQNTAAVLARADVMLSLAHAASRGGYCRPEVNDGLEIDISEGRHPMLEASDLDEPFVPNDAYLDCEREALLIITGPNMSGKSTYLRQVALIVIMAQMGSYVPARRAHIGVADQVFTRVGAADDLTRGRSTFMMEMMEVANILNNATHRSLVILDEVGRGTSTYDGISIAWATCEYIRQSPRLGCRTLFATHYHELTRLAHTCRGVSNYSVAVKREGEDIVFLREVVPGPTDRSYGIYVASLAGVPDEVIRRARQLLPQLEESSEISLGREPDLLRPCPDVQQRVVGNADSGLPAGQSTGDELTQPSLFEPDAAEEAKDDGR